LRSHCGIEYTCLYVDNTKEGFGDGGEAFSGGGEVPDIEWELDLICGEHGLRKILRQAILRPPHCIMLHIQTIPPEVIE